MRGVAVNQFNVRNHMDKAYLLASLVIRKLGLPEAWNNKDVQGAVIGFGAVALIGVFGWRAVPWLVQFFF
jgi:hypothetical protein